MAHFIPLKNREAKSLAKIFFKEYWCLHSLSKSIISIRDTVFISNFWTAVVSILEVRLDRSSAYHLQTDGQTERVNQILEQYIRTYCNWDQKDWLELLPYAEFCYNNTVHSSIKMTPFYAAYGQHPENNFADVKVNSSNVPSAEEWVTTIAKMRDDMRERRDIYRGSENENGIERIYTVTILLINNER